MPQPLRRALNDLVIGSEALARKPDLALLVMQQLAEWGRTEAHVELLVPSILHTDFGSIAAFLDAIKGPEARRAGTLACIRRGLKDSPFGIKAFDAIISLAESCRRQRSKFAHHVWGHSNDEPDVLLL